MSVENWKETAESTGTVPTQVVERFPERNTTSLGRSNPAVTLLKDALGVTSNRKVATWTEALVILKATSNGASMSNRFEEATSMPSEDVFKMLEKRALDSTIMVMTTARTPVRRRLASSDSSRYRVKRDYHKRVCSKPEQSQTETMSRELPC